MGSQAAMNRARFTDNPDSEGGRDGVEVPELCRSRMRRFYTWGNKYGGLEISEVRRLRQVENRRLSVIVAGKALSLSGR